jgi:hypothetical protein
MSAEVRNDGGNRTLIFLPGGELTAGGIEMQPLEQHPDYQTFLNQAATANWRIVALTGTQYPDYFEVLISHYASKYLTQDNRKPTLMGHSAGGVAGLFYAKDCPSENFFDQILLFNAPLIYPDDRILTDLRNAYVGTERVTANVKLTMSQFDPIMGWKVGNFTMMDAVEVVEKIGKVAVEINTTNVDYAHSPFDGVTVAWDVLSAAHTGSL